MIYIGKPPLASKKFQNNHHTEIIYSKKNRERYKRKNERHETLSFCRQNKNENARV